MINFIFVKELLYSALYQLSPFSMKVSLFCAPPPLSLSRLSNICRPPIDQEGDRASTLKELNLVALNSICSYLILYKFGIGSQALNLSFLRVTMSKNCKILNICSKARYMFNSSTKLISPSRDKVILTRVCERPLKILRIMPRKGKTLQMNM